MGVRTIGYRFTGDYRDLDAALDHLDQRITASVTSAERASKAAGTASTAAARGVEQTVKASATAVEQATARVAAADRQAGTAAEQYARAQTSAAAAAKAAAAAQERAALAAAAAQVRTGTAAEQAAARQVAAADQAAARVAAAQARIASTAEASARRETVAYERSAREQAAARTAAARQVEKAERDAESAAERRRAASTEIGQNLLYAGAATAAGIGVAVKAFADFDQSMSRAAAGTEATTEQLVHLRAAAIEAGAATQYSATEAADGITALGKAGVSVQDILGGGLQGALDLAAAGQLDVANAAEIAATAMTQFGLSGQDIPHVADLLAAAAGKAQGEVTDLANAMKYVGPVANGLGIDIEQTTGVLALFASQGILSEQAGTSFRGMLLSLTSPSEKTAELMESLGLRLYDAQGRFVGMEGVAGQLGEALGGMSAEARDAALGVLFGNEQVTAARILYRGGAEAVRDWTARVNDAGFASEQAATLTDNLAGDLERLKGSLSTAFISTGSGTNDGLRDLAQIVTDLVNAYGDLPEPVQKGAVTLGAFAAAAALTGGALLIALPRIAATKIALIELTGSAVAARAAVLGIATSVAAIAAAGAGGAILGDFIGQAQVATQDTDRLAESLRSLGQGGELGAAGLDLFESGFGPFKNEVDDTGDALKRFGVDAYNALDSGWDARLGRWQSMGSDVSEFREEVEQLDGALAKMVQGGDTAAAATAFDRLTEAAVKQGVPLAKIRAQFPEYTAALTATEQASKATTGATGELGGAMDATSTKAQQLATRLQAAGAAAAEATQKANATQLDVLGTYDPSTRDEKAEAAADRLAKARQRLADVEERIESRRKGATLGDEQALRRARESVEVAERAARAAGGGGLQETYRDTIRSTRQFTQDVSEALKRGLDPAIVQRLLEDGPQKAGPVLQEILSDHSGRLIDMTNESEKTLAELGALAVEQARLTARAVASESDRMTSDLATATQIATEKSRSAGEATAESVAKALRIAPAEVERIATEFGITLTRSTRDAVAARAIDVPAKGRISVETEGTAKAVDRLEEVQAAQANLVERRTLSIETVGTVAAISHYEEVAAASEKLRDKDVKVEATGTQTAVDRILAVGTAAKGLRDREVNIETAGTKRAIDRIDEVRALLRAIPNRKTITVDVVNRTTGQLSALNADRVPGGARRDGGQVLSPVGGAPRADDLLTAMSHREWVQPVASVDYYGDEFMRAIQYRTLPREFAAAMRGAVPGYRDGGQVGVAASAPAATVAAAVSGRPAAAPVVVRVPVHESRSRDTHLHGDVVLPGANPDSFRDWAGDLAARAGARYS